MKNLIKNKVEMRNQLKVEDLVIGKLYKVRIPDEIVMEGSYKPELWDTAKFSNYNKEMESLFFSNPKSGKAVCEISNDELSDSINEIAND